jgi:hypothetical protein
MPISWASPTELRHYTGSRRDSRAAQEVITAGATTRDGCGLLVLTLSAPALCQTSVPPVADTVRLSGPRFGFTVLGDGIVKKLKTDDGISVGLVVTQFGWQFEKQFYSGPNGPTAVTEAVLLFGGLERGVSSMAKNRHRPQTLAYHLVL